MSGAIATRGTSALVRHHATTVGINVGAAAGFYFISFWAFLLYLIVGGLQIARRLRA